MNIHEAKDIVIRIYYSSSYRKTTETEKQHIRDITKRFGDQFVQSCYVKAATKRRIEHKIMKNKGYKVRIPEGMKVKRELWPTTNNDQVIVEFDEKICNCNKIMNKNKHKILIPEGYEVDRAFDANTTDEGKTTTIVFKKVKKELPKTWEGYLRTTNKCYPSINHIRVPLEYNEAFEALGRLIELRDHYNDGWEPDWINSSRKYVIYIHIDKISAIDNDAFRSHVLAFKSYELRNEFLSNFAQLINEAKPLL